MKRLATTLLLLSSLLPPVSSRARDVFPEQPGWTQEFVTRAFPSADPFDEPRYGTYSVLLKSFRQAGDLRTWEIREHDSFTGRYRFSEWSSDGETIRIAGVDFPGPLGRMAEEFAFDFLRLPLRPGQRVDQPQWVTEVQGEEMIQLPGESFPRPAWKLSVIGTCEGDWSAVGRYWFVPGKGLVRHDLNARGWDIQTALAPVSRLR